MIVLPFLINSFIFKNHYFSSVSNDGWANFLGGYIGAIIGAIATITAVSIQIQNNERIRAEDEVLAIRPYLYLTAFGWSGNQREAKVSASLANIGLHSACDIYLATLDGDHPYDSKYLLDDHLALRAGESKDIELVLPLSKTVFFEFTFRDLKDNKYSQELRAQVDGQMSFSSFLVLEPKRLQQSIWRDRN